MASITSSKAKLRFNCRRGMSELENILYSFFDQNFDSLSNSQQIAFEELLSAEDNDLWNWLVTKQDTPPASLQDLIKVIHAAT